MQQRRHLAAMSGCHLPSLRPLQGCHSLLTWAPVAAAPGCGTAAAALCGLPGLPTAAECCRVSCSVVQRGACATAAAGQTAPAPAQKAQGLVVHEVRVPGHSDNSDAVLS